MKFFYTVAAGMLILAVVSGVACTLVCSHDCCPNHDNGAAQNCLNTHFTSSVKFEVPIVLTSSVSLEDIMHHVSRLPRVAEVRPDLRARPNLGILRI